jgi:hypothetical protein
MACYRHSSLPLCPPLVAREVLLQNANIYCACMLCLVHFSETDLGYWDASQSATTTTTTILPAVGTCIPDHPTRRWLHSTAVSAPTTTARSPSTSTTPALWLAVTTRGLLPCRAALYSEYHLLAWSRRYVWHCISIWYPVQWRVAIRVLGLSPPCRLLFHSLPSTHCLCHAPSSMVLVPKEGCDCQHSHVQTEWLDSWGVGNTAVPGSQGILPALHS